MPVAILDKLNDRYQIQSLLAEGGMSLVYRAQDLIENRPVVVKLLKPQSTSRRAEDLIRFRREAGIISQLQHPNLARIYSLEETKESSFLVMEFIAGTGLDAVLRQPEPVAVETTVDWMLQLAAVLDYVHASGVIHRDIKPGNIMVDGTRLFLLDFGLAQVMEFSRIMDQETVAGTFSYMSPEQAGLIRKPVDERSDLYSLGIIFYQLLTRQLPFSGDDLASLLHQQIAKPPVPLRQLNPNLPGLLEEIVLKLLKKDPEARYQSSQGLHQDLLRFQEGERAFVLGQSDRLKKLNYQTRLVGRDVELKTLQEAFGQARQGQGRACLIGGEAGRGKSRLVEEMGRTVLAQGGLWISGRCFDQENKIPYHPFVEALNEYLRGLERFSAEARAAAVADMKARLAGLDEVICRLNPGMRAVLGDTPGLVPLEPEKENRRFLMTCSGFFRGLASPEHPLVIMLDDLQWSDEGSLGLLSELLEDLHASPVLVLGTFRDNEVGPEHPLAGLMRQARERAWPLTRLTLTSLEPGHVVRLIGEMLQENEENLRELGDYVFRNTSGNPFFCIEVVRRLVHEKILEYRDSAWQVHWEQLKTLSVSATILDIILKRIDLLNEAQAGLLSTAAVIGRKFPLKLLFTLSDQPKEKVIAMVDECIELQLLERGLDRSSVLFVHDRIKEAFYQKVGPERKRQLHLRIAQALERTAGNDAEGLTFDLAHHYTEAAEDAKALQYLLPAAVKARAEYATQDAAAYYRAALAILERQSLQAGPAWLEAKEGLIDVYCTLGRGEDVIRLANELLPHKRTVLEKARVYRQMGYACYKQGAWNASVDYLVTGLELLGRPFPRTRVGLIAGLAQEGVLFLLNTTRRWWYLHRRQRPSLPENEEIIRLYQGLGWTFVLSDALKFLLLTLRILRHAETRMGQSRALGFGLAGHASLLMHLAWFRPSYVYHQRGLQLRQRLNDNYGTGQSLQFLGYFHCWKGEYDRSLEVFQQAKDLFSRIGDPWEQGMIVQGIGHCQFYRADYGPALKTVENFAEIGRKIQDHYSLSDADLWFCYICTEKGEFAKAEEYGRAALARSEEHGIKYIVCCSLIHLGYLELERKNWSAARDYLEQARRQYEASTFLRNYSVYVYPCLAQAWLDDYRQPGKTCDPATRRRIRKMCLEAVRKTKSWVNHHGQSLRVLGNYYAWTGKDRRAEACFLQSLRMEKRLGRRFEIGRTCEAYALFLASRKRPAEAQTYTDRAYGLFKEIGSQAALESLNASLPPASAGPEAQQDRFQEKLELFSIINAGHFLSSILDLNLLLEKIMAICLEVTGAERGFLFLYSEEKNAERTLQVKVARSLDPTDAQAGEFAVSWTAIRKAETSRKPLNVADAGQDEELAGHRSVVRYGLRSILCLPLVTKRAMLGLIYLDNRLVGGLFTEEKIKLLKILVNQAAISIENARLYREMKEKTRMEEELRLGREIQMKLLPRQTPESTGLKVQGLMEPAKEIGGDYYDFIACDEGRRLAVVIGDVTGKGVAAGLVMATAKAIFHSLSDLGIGPREILLQANQILSGYLDGEKLMTVSYLEWDAGKKSIRYANAGHEPVILCRPVQPAGAEVTLLKSRGIFIGLVHDLADKFEEGVAELRSGDKLLLYTDGVTDALNLQSEHFTRERLVASVIRHATLPLEGFLKAVKQELDDFIAGQEPFDDITLVALEVL